MKGTEDAPYFENLNTEYTIAEDSVGAAVTFNLRDAETEAATLMLQAVSLDETQTLLKDSGIVITGLGDGNAAVTLKFTPVANAYGDVTISLALGRRLHHGVENLRCCTSPTSTIRLWPKAMKSPSRRTALRC